MEENIFSRWDKNIRGAEASVVNFLSAVIPWGAPVPVAYMTFMHMEGVLQFPFVISVITAIVIEILGFSTVSTIIGLWNYNRRYTADSKKKTPIEVVIFAFVFYLAIVLTVNVLLDASQGSENAWIAVIVVRGLLTLLTIPAALILGVRTLHTEMLESADNDKRERAFKKQYGDDWFEMMYGKPQNSSQRTREPKELSPKAREVLSFIGGYDAENGRTPSLGEIMEATGVVKSYASTLRSKYVEENTND